MSEFIGTIKIINTEVQVSASFKKREIVIKSSEQYPQEVIMEAHQDKCDLLSNYKPGDEVKVNYNLRGRMWTNPQGEEKYFNTVQIWRIEKHVVQGPEPHHSNHPTNQAPAYQESPQSFNEEDHDDLPF